MGDAIMAVDGSLMDLGCQRRLGFWFLTAYREAGGFGV